MYSPGDKCTRVFALFGGLLAPALTGGCARPAGPLFAPAAQSLVWPPAPEQTRIRFVGSLSGSADLKAPQSGGEAMAAALRGPRRPIGFAAPHSLARSGNLLVVADVGQAGVHALDLVERTHVLVTGWADERLNTPIGVCMFNGNFLVADAGRHEIIEFSTAGAYQRRFGAESLTRPVGVVAVAPRGQIYVVDGGAHRISVYDASGSLVRHLGGPGSGPGQFNYPTHLAWDGGTRIAVADSGNFRVQLLDLDGTFLAAIGSKGDAAGDFALPKGVAFDSAGHLYVVDAQFENVQIFNDQGQLLLAFGREGSDAGQFALPAGLTIDAQDRIWVADSANHRVQVFDYVGDGP